MTRRIVLLSVLAVVALAGAWTAFRFAPRYYRSRAPVAAPATQAPAPATPERKIKAMLYFIAEDGLSIVATEREVPFAEPVVAQARNIVTAQLGDAPAPLTSSIPRGTTLRSVFITERGDAFVDLSAEVTTNHPGGAIDELLTVYTLVNALTVNLPSIARVQILVNGKEADTLAGHVDLRHPLQKNLHWVATPAPPAATREP